MLEAGWVFHKRSDDRWEILSPRDRRFFWTKHDWEPSRREVEACLEADEEAIRSGEFTPFTGTARLVNPPRPGVPDTLCAWLADGRRVKGLSVLRAACRREAAGDERLLQAGARKVDTLPPPWSAAADTARSFPYQMVVCGHLADCLPPADRRRLLVNLATHLHPDGEIHFSFYEMSALPPEAGREPFEDGYRFKRGRHHVFLKPWLPGQARKELERQLGGYTEVAQRPYDEFFCRWRPDA